MLYVLVTHFRDAIEGGWASFLRVFAFETFQALAAVLLSFAACVAAGPAVIAWLTRKKIGDAPQFDNADLDAVMAGKRGTPTMGGLLIVGAIVLAGVLLADLRNFYVVLALAGVVMFGAVGAVDDWLKLTRDRRGEGSRDGLSMSQKLAFQTLISLVLAGFVWHYGRDVPAQTSFYVPFVKAVEIRLPWWAFVPIGTVVMVGASNGVNLADGLDGLAAGMMAIVALAFVVLSVVIGDAGLAGQLLYPHVPQVGQMAVFAGAMVGACLGFLWFNCPPARVFMGDTGSLALGGLIGYVAVVVRQELMLALVGGVFVAESLSVLIQRYYFKYTRLRYGEGRRVFRMAPIHHHFQRLGWAETQVVVRFWLVTAILAAVGLATVKLR